MFKKVLMLAFLCFSIISSGALHAYTYLFSHGFGETWRSSRRYVKRYRWAGREWRNQNYILDGVIKLFNYPDAIFKGLPPRISQVGLAQKNEIDKLKNAYDQIRDENVILFGVSRGASVAINFTGIHDPRRIKAVVVESPFDHIRNVFYGHWFVNALSKIPFLTKDHIFKLFLMFTKYRENGEHPIDHIENIRQDLPIMIICSEEDGVVPCRSTVNLYKKLLECGHEHAYLVKFDTGKHAKLLWSEHGQQLRNVVHAFYEKYELPHNSEFAHHGQALLETCQPSLVDLEQEAKNA